MRIDVCLVYRTTVEYAALLRLLGLSAFFRGMDNAFCIGF